ncbi:MAG: 5-formyltetrahydrofolate cyclo-ligase [Alphaproteobacteria bacterium]|nr:5-formyltetrahydrofolate cyclo-ligase [Alphaproteobacteria bacterium]MDA7982174.1 5-formyltetrahydrofolate cyclo-ligase [Alphaproteobacteria bacterium]MDA7983859.1 5-formyltetrahydrofolate cyclo-ligase [Alphaproteobacteria bacterium]MDA7989433.1 5-formyltetrahydrofolate cyclo-ligase [Alphaproteobacteria bacterium]MDA8010100.1 5-formyltetrahydrofolate cyclo-ligase [Alphaproteobacteria bacterium]
MQTTETGAAKKTLRENAFARRRAAARQKDAAQAPARLAEVFFQHCEDVLAECETVAGYWPMRDEIDPRLLLSLLHGRGHILALPVIETRGAALSFRRWRPGDALVGGELGTSEPSDGAETARPQMVLTPLVAFDASGHRLGYGGGYYDRTLAALGDSGGVVSVGLAWHAQMEESPLPRARHDRALDRILTERGCVFHNEFRADGADGGNG